MVWKLFVASCRFEASRSAVLGLWMDRRFPTCAPFNLRISLVEDGLVLPLGGPATPIGHSLVRHFFVWERSVKNYPSLGCHSISNNTTSFHAPCIQTIYTKPQNCDIHSCATVEADTQKLGTSDLLLLNQSRPAENHSSSL
jgi:hypothetical protein